LRVGFGYYTFSLLATRNLSKVNTLTFIMENNRYYPYILVAFQFGCVFYIALSAPVLSSSIPGMLVESAGIFLAVHAIYIIRIRNVNITPTVKPNSELVTSGPYKLIRHPMYIAQIIAIMPLVIEYFSIYRLSVLIILSVTLLIKVQYEEKQLSAQFPDYEIYKLNTWKFIPYIY